MLKIVVFFLSLFVSLSPLVTGSGHPDYEEYLAEFTVEIRHSEEIFPEYMPVPRHPELRSKEIWIGSKAPRLYSWDLKPEWVGPDLLQVTIDRLLREQGKRLAEVSRTRLGSFALALDQPVVVALADEEAVLELCLHRNVPETPAPLKIGHDFLTVPSIEIGEIIETRGSFVIEVINATQENVYGLAAASPSGIVSRGSSYEDPLLRPGESRRVIAERLPQESYFFVQAVLFADGRFEGDPDIGSLLLASRWAYKLHLQTVLPLWEKALERLRVDPVRALEDLERAIDNLEFEITPRTEEAFYQEHPELALYGSPPRRKMIWGKIKKSLIENLEGRNRSLQESLAALRTEPAGVSASQWLGRRLEADRAALAYLSRD